MHWKAEGTLGSHCSLTTPSGNPSFVTCMSHRCLSFPICLVGPTKAPADGEKAGCVRVIFHTEELTQHWGPDTESNASCGSSGEDLGFSGKEPGHSHRGAELRFGSLPLEMFLPAVATYLQVLDWDLVLGGV